MNKNSLSYYDTKKQQQSSWIDDDFPNENFAAKGFKTMSHERLLSNYAQELVEQHGIYNGQIYELTIEMLPEEERTELVRLHMESTDRDTSECIYGDDFTIDSEFKCALLEMLKYDTKETRENFAYVTRKNILLYYTPYLNELLLTACDNLLHINMNEQGYYAHEDHDNGDVIWGKF